MAVNLSALSQVTTTATGLANLILVTPVEQNVIQAQSTRNAQGNLGKLPAAFVFDYDGENTILLESDVTDHFVENNTTIQDQIALKPEVITVQGFVGELNDILPKALQPLKEIADKLTVVSGYIPSLSVTALNILNTAAQAYAVANLVNDAASSAWDTIISGSAADIQTKQQIAFNKFYAFWQNRQLFSVSTPWNAFGNMVIKSLRAVQDADTRMITNFEITFKKMRFAQTVTLTGQQLQTRLNAQGATVVNNGTYSAPESGHTIGGGPLDRLN